MSLLLFIAIVVVVMVLLMWAIYYLPMPPGSPAWLKNFIYVVLLLAAIIVILSRSGVASAQTRPVPQLKKSAPAPIGEIYKAPRSANQPAWTGFKGATRCEQRDKVITCDNGYRQTVR